VKAETQKGKFVSDRKSPEKGREGQELGLAIRERYRKKAVKHQNLEMPAN